MTAHGTTTLIRPLPFALLLAPAIATAQNDACPQFFSGGTPPAFANPRLAQGAILLCNDGFAVTASSVTRGALWSAERLTRDLVEAARHTPRENRFHPDARLPPEGRAELADYRNSGFDRGHMAPSGDMPDAQSQRQTFSLANMVPQAPALNRGPWERIESAVRRLARRQGELYVVTGPAFTSAQVDTVGDNHVPVPTATWKAIYDPQALAAGAWLCSNTDHPACQFLDINALVGQVGIDPFPGVPTTAMARMLPLRLPENGAGEPRRPVQSRREYGPASQQPAYAAARSAAPGHLVLGDNAATVSRLLGIQLTCRRQKDAPIFPCAASPPAPPRRPSPGCSPRGARSPCPSSPPSLPASARSAA